MLGSCVLFLLTVWMIPVVRVENPLRLIIPRSSNDESLPLSRLWRKRLSAYLVSHFLILLLTLSFAGELLMDYESHNIIGRFEILLLVSISAALVQVSTLHFLPHLMHQGWIASRASRSLHGGPNQGCLATSHEYWSNCHVIALCWEDVIKRGAFLLILFFLEILIVRINVGPTLFKEMGILNQQWLWILAWLGYFIYFRYYLQLLRQDARDTPLYSSPVEHDGRGASVDSFVDSVSDGSGSLDYDGDISSETTSLFTPDSCYTDGSSMTCTSGVSAPSYSFLTVDLSSASRFGTPLGTRHIRLSHCGIYRPRRVLL